MLYSCYNPERIEGLFLQSSVAKEDTTSPDFVYDPYTIRIKDESLTFPTRREVDGMLYKFDNHINLFAELDYKPYCLQRRTFKSKSEAYCLESSSVRRRRWQLPSITPS